MSGRIRATPVPDVINGTWKIGKKLGFGSFGKIYLGSRDDSGLSKRSTSSPPEVAIKLEPVDAAHPQLLLEAKVCRRLQGAEGVPLVYAYGTEQGWNFMAIDYLGPSLEDLFQLCGRVFTFHTTALLALQMLQRVETLHSKGYLHRDLKPDNFLMGRTGSSHQNIVHMIDFGLAKPFRGSHGQHISYRDGKSLTGTARYASINTHLGIEQSRRDDIEGLAVVLVYFSKGQLPWQGLKAVPKKDRHEGIMRTKLQTSPEDLCKGCPKEFLAFLRHARSLEFSSKPDYGHLRRLLQDCLLGLSNARELCFVASTTASGSGISNADGASTLFPPSRKTSRNTPKKLLKLGLTPSAPAPFTNHVITSPLYEYQGLSARNSSGGGVDISSAPWDTSILFDWQYMRHQRQMFLDSEHAMIRYGPRQNRVSPALPNLIEHRSDIKQKRNITIVEDQNLFPPTPKSNVNPSVPFSNGRSREAEPAKILEPEIARTAGQRPTRETRDELSPRLSPPRLSPPHPPPLPPPPPTPSNKIIADGVNVIKSNDKLMNRQYDQTNKQYSRRVTNDESWLAEKSDKKCCPSSSSSTKYPDLIMSVERPSGGSAISKRCHHGMRTPTSGTKTHGRQRSSGSKLRQETNRATDLGIRTTTPVSILSGRAKRDISSATSRLASPNTFQVRTYEVSKETLGRPTVVRTSVIHEKRVVESRPSNWNSAKLLTSNTVQSLLPQNISRPSLAKEPHIIPYREVIPQYRQSTRATTGSAMRDVGRIANPLSPSMKVSPANPMALIQSRSPPIVASRNPPIVISTRDATGRVDRSSFHPVLATALSRDGQTNPFNNRMVRSVVQA